MLPELHEAGRLLAVELSPAMELGRDVAHLRSEVASSGHERQEVATSRKQQEEVSAEAWSEEGDTHVQFSVAARCKLRERQPERASESRDESWSTHQVTQ